MSCKIPLADYFTEKNWNFILNSSLLETINLSVKNFFTDEVDINFDLILFRNRLIYFNPQLQSVALKLIHENLNRGGFLIIGIGESLNLQYESKFNIYDKNENIFKKTRF